MSDAAPATAPKRHRRWHRFVLRSMATVVLVLALALGAGTVIKGLPVAVPPWLQAKIEGRIAEVLPQARVRFGEMVIVVGEGWRPKVRLRDVVVRNGAGQEIISFNEFKATFATRPLLRGQIQPKVLSLSGVVARLKRGADGRVSIRGGDTENAPAREAATLPQLIGELDEILQSPALAALRNVELRALTLRFDDERVGRGWTVDGGRLRLQRTGDDLALSADLAVLGGGASVATLAANYSSRIGQTQASFGVTFDDVPARDIAAQGPAFAWLDVLRAPISGSVRSGLTAAGRFTPLNATLQIGAGAVQPNAATKPIPFEGARSYFSYTPARRLLRFDELSVRSKWISGQASGTAVLKTDGEQGPLTELVAQIELSNLVANPFDLYPEPVDLSEADMDFRLQLDPFRITLGRLQISDRGKTLLVDGDLSADPAGWRLALDGRMDGLDPSRLLALWPQGVKPKTRTWLAENLLAGQVENIDLAFRAAPSKPQHSFLAFDFDGADVRFLKTMPPITGGQGHFSLGDDRLVVTVDQGAVEPPVGGVIRVDGSSFILPDVRVRDGTPAVIRLQTRSSITAALSLLNFAPLSVMDKAGMPVDLAQGQVDVQGTLAVPLKKGGDIKDVSYFFNGDLRAVQSDTLVKDRRLESARLDLAVDNRQLRISGPGKIDGVAFSGAWQQPIGAGANRSSLNGQVGLDQAALDAFGVALPDGTLSGSTTGNIALEFERGKAPEFVLTSALRGMRIRVPQLSWSKAANQSGNLTLKGRLGDPAQIDTLNISGPGLSARGSVKLRAGGALERVRFDNVSVGNWLNIPVDLIGQGSGKAVQVSVRGGSMDLRRAEFGPAQGGTAGPPMLINLERLQITDTIALSNLQGRFDIANGMDGRFEARLNGATPVQGRVVPQNGRSAVRMTSDDAGGVLASAGLLKQVKGGTLSLTLLPVGSGGAFDGELTMGGVRIKDAPGIAALLNAVSVVGLVNELNGDGIYFDEVEGRFRLTPDRLTLTEGSAVGASMGLSMDGIYALNSGQLQMQGSITPVYLLNGIGSVLTRKGEGLFGFHYTLTGAASDPKVSVNPLSALTPGMFRDIFRSPTPELPGGEGAGASALPSQKPETQKPVVPRFEGR
jgi:Protein of unknown function/AsmA-like C-terminal region